MAVTGDAAAKCYVVLGRKISGREGNGAPSERAADSVNIQVHSPPPALLSPAPSNLAPGGFVLQNLIDASDPSLIKCVSAAARKMSPRNPDSPLLSTSLSVILFLPRETRFMVSWFTSGDYS